MNSQPDIRHQHQACSAIEGAAFDFTAKFYAAYDLFNIAQKNVSAVTPRAIEALKTLLLGTAFGRQRQRLVLFREAANVLSTTMRLGYSQPIGRLAYEALRTVLVNGHNKAHQAAAEALGSLPTKVRGSAWPRNGLHPVSLARWEDVRKANQLPDLSSFELIGRSLVACLADQKHLVVVKLARTPEDEPGLLAEIEWMRNLSASPVAGEVLFDVPTPLAVNGSSLFQLKGPFPLARSKPGAVKNPMAIGFVASKDYYSYPNPSDPRKLPSPDQFLEVMGRNAYLLGRLSGQGIIHQAPIPLFHNRVQQERRRDGGAYEWFRGGRLDRWLASCAYPNFGFSGLRDFEHLTTFNGSSLELYRLMGNHLLSLLLVAGSYFRAKDPLRKGWDPAGRPADTRDLFDATLLHTLIFTISNQYHFGFVGRPAQNPPLLDEERLAGRMIEEMGVDYHMEELLRATDQQQMSQAGFETFLSQRGYTSQTISCLEKGAGDLAILSGPHLGAFNRGISLPELTEAVATIAAMCVAQKFLLAQQ